MSAMTMHAGHDIQVTGEGPFGRAWLDCSCGLTKVFGSKAAAVLDGLHHHHSVGGCNCPPSVRERPVHPDHSITQPNPA